MLERRLLGWTLGECARDCRLSRATMQLDERAALDVARELGRLDEVPRPSPVAPALQDVIERHRATVLRAAARQARAEGHSGAIYEALRRLSAAPLPPSR